MMMTGNHSEGRSFKEVFGFSINVRQKIIYYLAFVYDKFYNVFFIFFIRILVTFIIIANIFFLKSDFGHTSGQIPKLTLTLCSNN